MLTISFTQLTIGLLLIGFLQWILSFWIKSRLIESIKHEYSIKLEDIRFSQLQRQKAELISKFFAKWIKFQGKEDQFLKPNELIEYYEQLNQMSLELSIWLKDEELLSKIMGRLKRDENSPNIRQLTGRVRKLVQENKKDGFDPEEIILWPNDETSKKIFSANK